MVTFLMVLFVILCIFLSFFILIQQGKGDMGIGALGGASQTLFGGSGGQDFFIKITWVLGFIFIFGALGISLVNIHTSKSVLKDYTMQVETPKEPLPAIPTDASA